MKRGAAYMGMPLMGGTFRFALKAPEEHLEVYQTQLPGSAHAPAVRSLTMLRPEGRTWRENRAEQELYGRNRKLVVRHSPDGVTEETLQFRVRHRAGRKLVLEEIE